MIFFFLLAFTTSIGKAQKYDYIWLMGYESDLSMEGIEGIEFDFNTTTVSISPVSIGASLDISSAIISDSAGNLLFYTDGCRIIGANHQILENGEGINPGEVHDIQCGEDGFGYTAWVQSSIILPTPGNGMVYYILHKHIIYQYQPEFEVITDGLYYTKVDVSLNNGEGSVVEKNIPLISEPLTAGQLTAVKHANGRDWWIITGGRNNNMYYRLLLGPNGIEVLPAQMLGESSGDGGQACFSPDGEKYARFFTPDGLFLFDFDRQTGYLSNFQQFEIPNESQQSGVAFSPNSRFLYACTRDTIYQYDLDNENIESSRQVVAIYDGYQSLFNTTFFNAQLAPDCKIYINTFAFVDVLHVINFPDEPNEGCGVLQHAIQLPYWHSRALPSFPNYRLGPLVEGEDPPPPCQPVVSVQETVRGNTPKAYLFPNPAPGYFKVAFDAAPLWPGQVLLYNTLGRLAYEGLLAPGQREQRFEVQGLPPGMYFYAVAVGGQLWRSGKVVVGR
ncbi:MAG: T9SS type A sorting domain-containing protein [Phaeodactylibacter sp.]|nr:T9SS type A sorting domain-containing protein [Phaeodactylibacter sp.]